MKSASDFIPGFPLINMGCVCSENLPLYSNIQDMFQEKCPYLSIYLRHHIININNHIYEHPQSEEKCDADVF